MGEICISRIVLVGNPRYLQKIVDAAQNINGLDGLKKKLKLQFPDIGNRYSIQTEMISAGELWLTVTTELGSVREFWNAIVERMGLQGFASYSEVGNNSFTENDPKGIWFPDNYKFVPESDKATDYFPGLKSSFYRTPRQIEETLNRVSGEDYTYDEWTDLMDDMNIGQLIYIKRFGSQTLPFSKEKMVACS